MTMTASTTAWVVTTVLVLVAIGCSEETNAPLGDGVTLRDSAGTTIVENHAPVWTGGEGWSVAEEPVLRLGDVAGDVPARQFSRIQGVTRLSDGRIVVVEGEGSEVRWFDPRGAHLTTAGGEGGGPGEFNYAAELIRLPGDTVLVVDRPLVEHVFFSPQGSFVRQEALDYERYQALGSWAECASRTLPDGSVLGCLRDPALPQRPSGPDPGPGHLRYFLRFARVPFGLDDVDTLGVYGSLEQWGVPHGDRTAFARHPFHSRTVTGSGGDPMRVAIAVNPEYSIEVWTPEGTLERIVRRPGGNRAPGDDANELARERFESYARDDPALLQRFLSEIPMPDLVPAVGQMLFGPSGDLWVRWAAAPPERGPVYDVFDDQGRWLGQVDGPEGFIIQEVGLDYLLGIRYDDLGVPSVEVYELDRTGGA